LIFYVYFYIVFLYFYCVYLAFATSGRFTNLLTYYHLGKVLNTHKIRVSWCHPESK